MAPIPVIAAIIWNESEGKVLICQRKSGALARKWEFPGGKLESGESPEQCLVREIQEELAIDVEVSELFKVVNAHYDHGDYVLIAYHAKFLGGEISLRVHQNYVWVEPQRLLEFDLAKANIPIAHEIIKLLLKK
ncbi:MAG: (deoxy)nucleoside triphosphate pyrophosphohydrolase [Firmicutes bacterium]|nr:(deoxy)nucleoside triphosphate pyrophosphohydrolase [Bacillota bacterium]